jgi:hypothetical protein
MTSIRKVLSALAITAIPAALAFSATPALAAPKDDNPPTLHGFCSLGNTCTDNGTDTPTSVNPPVFAFAASGQGDSGTLWIDILTPNNLGIPGSFTISGALSGTASLYSSTPWTSGFLKDYLGGLDASPANGIGAYLPSTQGCAANQGCDPGATGYYVFQANLGSTTLLGTSGVGGAGQDAYLLTLGQSLARGGYIVGFLQQDDDYGATANSGAILETHDPHQLPEPSTWAMMLFGFGAIGVSMRRSRRKNTLATQLA